MKKPFDGEYAITQIFGVNPQDYAQFGLKGHNGYDYALPTGTKVLAPHSGKVIEATLDPKGYGLYIKIENDIEGSVLAHLKEFRVGVGDIVSEGQLIAYSDNSGNSTGPHLHWGYYRHPRNRQNGYAGFIDQTPYLTSQSDALSECLKLHKEAVEKLERQEKLIADLKATEERLKSEKEEVKDEFEIQIKNMKDADTQSKKQLEAQQDELEVYKTVLEKLQNILK